MISKKLISRILLLIWIVLLILFLFADVVGVGQAPGFGQNQCIGTIIGILVVIVSLIVRRRV